LASDQGYISLLVLLDLSVAFDTIDHNILLERLENLIGIKGSALTWFKSYLSDRYQCVHLKNKCSYQSRVKYGVPQGSILGPILFTLYMLPLGKIIRRHGINFHCYADDTQLYISAKPNEDLCLNQITDCIREIRKWMTLNFLLLNSDKTEVLLLGPKLDKIDNIVVEIDGHLIIPVSVPPKEHPPNTRVCVRVSRFRHCEAEMSLLNSHPFSFFCINIALNHL
uniref:Reverse transcriptase domain-containing protein n=1 Tax=Pygocentrus nattereri TaxID=42514 RepID=A0AAR2IPE7_PYGNA